MLEKSATLLADAGKGGRANGKDKFRMARRRYQTGCLFIRGKRRKVWVARWREDVLRPDGTPGRVLRSEVIGLVAEIPTRRESRKLLDARLRPINQGQHRPQSTVTLAQFVAAQFEPGVLPTLKFATQEIYSLLLHKHLLPPFGDQRLPEISKEEVQRFVLEKLRQGLSWETVDHLRHLLSKVLGTAVSWGYLAENPVRGVKMPERTLKRPRRFLQADEVQRLLESLDEPARTVVLVAVLTGLRIGEILGLRWGRVDLLAGSLRVEEKLYKGRFGTPKTRASRREIPLAQVLVRVFLAYHSRSGDLSPDDLVFATRKGTPLSPDNLRNRDLRPACQLAGFKPIDWHALRRTHSTLLHALGTPLKVAQAQLGHSRLATTLEVYTHALPEAQREAVTKLEGILFPNVPKLHQEAAGGSEKTPPLQ